MITKRTEKIDLISPELSRAFRWPRLVVSDRWLASRDGRLGQPPPAARLSMPEKEPHHSSLVWMHRSGRYIPCVPLEEADDYEPHAAYDRACKQRNPKLSPHTAFRRVSKLSDLLFFLRDFGPLTNGKAPGVIRDGGREPGPEEGIVEWLPEDEPKKFVNLDDFWRKQRHYDGVVRLWDVLAQHEGLKAQWQRLLVERSEPFYDEAEDWWHIEQWSAESKESSRSVDLVEWVSNLSAHDLRISTTGFIVRQVRENATGGMFWRWHKDGLGGILFAPEAKVGSLWAAIWEFFALDTGAGHIWRVCPHCGKLFYPSRRDRFFCTPRQQQLYSKRRYWRQREAERKKARKANN
jgi:hypothetical protein